MDNYDYRDDYFKTRVEVFLLLEPPDPSFPIPSWTNDHVFGKSSMILEGKTIQTDNYTKLLLHLEPQFKNEYPDPWFLDNLIKQITADYDKYVLGKIYKKSWWEKFNEWLNGPSPI